MTPKQQKQRPHLTDKAVAQREEREIRLSKALRENLKRRREQLKALKPEE
jgi:hypothetical protein